MDRMPWFKWWDGTAGDPKMRMIAEQASVPVCTVVGIWAYLLEKASTSRERGVIPEDLDVELMAFTLQVAPFDIETVRNAMKRCNLVTERGEIAKWEERQAKREKTEPPGASTARVQRMREKKKQQENKDIPKSDGDKPDVTDETDETVGNDKQRHKKKNREEVEEKTKPKPSSSAGAEAFDRFWTAYPRKEGKQAAVKAWGKLKTTPELVEQIMLAIDAQKAGDAWMRDKGKYIPHPATWLNGGRWLDEVRQYEPPALKLPPGWWETHAAAEAAGLMLTPPLKPNKGEYLREFVGRIRLALQQVDAPDTGNGVMAAPPVVAPYVPPMPAEGTTLTQDQQRARMDELKATMRGLGLKTGKQLQEEQGDE